MTLTDAIWLDTRGDHPEYWLKCSCGHEGARRHSGRRGR